MQWVRLIGLLWLSWWGVSAALAASTHYEESVKELTESIIVEVAKDKRHSLAVVNFTDLEGNVGPVGRFLAEELSASLMLSREVQVLDRNQLSKVLKDHAIAKLETADPETVKKVGTMAGVDCLITGTLADTPEGLRVTAKVIATDTGRVIAGTRTIVAKTGPIAEMLAQAGKSPEEKKAPPPKPTAPPGTPTYENEWYRLFVASARRSNNKVTLLLYLENLAGRDFRLLCKLRETYLQDEHGAEWHQDAAANREGLCVRGLTMQPGNKKRATLAFTAERPKPGSVFTLKFHEHGPRRDVVFSIPDIRTEPPEGK